MDASRLRTMMALWANMLAADVFLVPLFASVHPALGFVAFFVILGALEAAYGLFDEFVMALQLPSAAKAP